MVVFIPLKKNHSVQNEAEGKNSLLHLCLMNLNSLHVDWEPNLFVVWQRSVM